MEGLLRPQVDEDGLPFWEAANRGELSIQCCGNCGRLRFPPRPLCPNCASFDCRWTVVSGRGEVWSYVVAHPPLIAWYASYAPYLVVLVALEEDSQVRLIGNVVSQRDAPINELDSGLVWIGMPVQAVFPQITPEFVLPRWTPRASCVPFRRRG